MHNGVYFTHSLKGHGFRYGGPIASSHVNFFSNSFPLKAINQQPQSQAYCTVHLASAAQDVPSFPAQMEFITCVCHPHHFQTSQV